MYTVSADYLTAITQRWVDDRISVSIVLNATDTLVCDNGDLMSDDIYIENQAITGSGFNIGAACQAEFGCTVIDSVTDENRMIGKQATVTYSLLLADGETYEDVPMGVFDIISAERISPDSVKIVALDRLQRFAKNIPMSDMVWEKTVFEVLYWACYACNVQLGVTQVDVEAMPNGTVTVKLANVGGNWQSEIVTYLDVIGYIAQLLCGFAYADRSGHLVIRQLVQSTAVLSIDASGRSAENVSDDTVSFSGISTIVSNAGGAGTTYRYNVPSTPATGNVLSIPENPLMRFLSSTVRQAIADTTWTQLSSVSYRPAEMTIFGRPEIDLGDSLTFTGGAAASGTQTLVTSYRWKYRDIETVKGCGIADPERRDAAVKRVKQETVAECTGQVAQSEQAMQNAIAAAIAAIPPQVVALTQDDYDALETPSPTALYVIIAGTEAET